VTAALEQTLEQQSLLSAFGFGTLMVVVVLFTVCFLLQTGRVPRQLRHLQATVSNATPWKKISGHELQHVRNHDLESLILLEALKAMCSWNPAVWLWHNEFDCLQEFACDEVLVNERQVSRSGYGNCLLEVASAAKGSTLLASSNMVPRFSFWPNNQQQLRRRILMLMKTEGTYSTSKSVCYSLLIGAALLVEAGCVANGNQATQSQPDIIPLTRVPPNYPAQALAEKKEAWVQLEFSIDATGAVYEPKVLDHCVFSQGTSGKDCDEKSDLFDEAALTAISKWTYESRARKGVQTVVRSQLTK
jgi:hypothetical protein